MSELKVHPLCVVKMYRVAKALHASIDSAAKAILERRNPYLQRYLIESWKPTLRETISLLEEMKNVCVPSESAKKVVENVISNIRAAIESEDPDKVFHYLWQADEGLADAMRYIEHFVEYGREAPY